MSSFISSIFAPICVKMHVLYDAVLLGQKQLFSPPPVNNCCCFSGANPYLTFHCASQGTILIDLAPDDKEYQSVEEEVCVNNRPDQTFKLMKRSLMKYTKLRFKHNNKR